MPHTIELDVNTTGQDIIISDVSLESLQTAVAELKAGDRLFIASRFIDDRLAKSLQTEKALEMVHWILAHHAALEKENKPHNIYLIRDHDEEIQNEAIKQNEAQMAEYIASLPDVYLVKGGQTADGETRAPLTVTHPTRYQPVAAKEKPAATSHTVPAVPGAILMRGGSPEGTMPKKASMSVLSSTTEHQEPRNTTSRMASRTTFFEASAASSRSSVGMGLSGERKERFEEASRSYSPMGFYESSRSMGRPSAIPGLHEEEKDDQEPVMPLSPYPAGKDFDSPISQTKDRLPKLIEKEFEEVKGLRIYATTTQGRKIEPNEDRYFSAVVNGFSTLTDEQKSVVMKNTFQNLNLALAKYKIGKKQGATLCVVVLSEKGVFSANIGDSIPIIEINGKRSAFIHKLRSLDDPEDISRLIKALPKEDDESTELVTQEAGKNKTHAYIHHTTSGIRVSKNATGGINLAATMGDLDILNIKDSVHIKAMATPDQMVYDFSEKDNEGKIYLMTDGLYQHVSKQKDKSQPLLKRILDDVEEAFIEMDDMVYSKINAMLINRAYKKQSNDHMTQLLIPFNRKSLQELGNRSLVVGVSDGHGRRAGHQVSEFLSQCFVLEMKVHIEIAHLRAEQEALMVKVRAISLGHQVKNAETIEDRMDEIEERVTDVIEKSLEQFRQLGKLLNPKYGVTPPPVSSSERRLGL